MKKSSESTRCYGERRRNGWKRTRRRLFRYEHRRVPQAVRSHARHVRYLPKFPPPSSRHPSRRVAWNLVGSKAYLELALFKHKSLPLACHEAAKDQVDEELGPRKGHQSRLRFAASRHKRAAGVRRLMHSLETFMSLPPIVAQSAPLCAQSSAGRKTSTFSSLPHEASRPPRAGHLPANCPQMVAGIRNRHGP